MADEAPEDDIQRRTFAEGGERAHYEPPHRPEAYPAAYSVEVFFEDVDEPRIMVDLEGVWGRITYFYTLDEAKELGIGILEAVEACREIERADDVDADDSDRETGPSRRPTQR